MEDIEFSPEFCRFIQTAIPAVEAAELLLLFRSRPKESFSPGEALARLGPGVVPGQLAKHLEVFESLGLLQSIEGRWQYHEGDAAGFANQLAQAYTQRPVTLIRIIYALRDSKIQSFADAFKLRRS